MERNGSTLKGGCNNILMVREKHNCVLVRVEKKRQKTCLVTLRHSNELSYTCEHTSRFNT